MTGASLPIHGSRTRFPVEELSRFAKRLGGPFHTEDESHENIPVANARDRNPPAHGISV